MAVLGHRGTGSGAGENTLAAFGAALDAGADGVELDVRRTRDGALAVFHDPVIEGLGPVADLAVADLPSYVPMLEPVLELCSGAGLVNIEVKNFPTEPGYDPDDLAARQVAALLLERDGPAVIVSSFTTSALDAVRDAAPEVPTGLLILPGAPVEELLRVAVERGYSAIHPHYSSVSAGLVASARAAGLAVNTWTVNDPSDVQSVIDAGVQSVITDRVAEVVALVSGAGSGAAQE